VNVPPVFDNINIYLFIYLFIYLYLFQAISLVSAVRNQKTFLRHFRPQIFWLRLWTWSWKLFEIHIKPITNSFKTIWKHVGRNLIEVRSFVY